MKYKICLLSLFSLFTTAALAEQSVDDRLSTIEMRLDAIEKRIGGDETTPVAGKVTSSSSSKDILAVSITNKRYVKKDFEDNIWWDATYTANGLKAPARAIKGVLVFADLFEEPQFKIQVTIDDPIDPKLVITNKGIGFDYNQFKGDHKWMRSTELRDMKIWFETKSVLYQDGTTEKFDK